MDGVEYTYYYAGDKLVRMTMGDSLTMDFVYDQNGQPYAMRYNDVRLYYVLNQQGDVVRLVTTGGESYGIYKYDAWGNILYNTDNQWLNNNPLRYRGYVYDTETQLYYCQSRYYDPAVGRFINADAFASTGQGILGNNMFAYCLNNPVRFTDTQGQMVYDALELGADEDETFDPDSGGGYASNSAVSSIGTAIGVGIVAATTSQKENPENIYTVYFLYAAGRDPTQIVYVGRVKTDNFDTRMAYHKTQGRLLLDSISGLNYAECRALEQGGMMYHHTINRGNRINNQIRGVSPTNGNRHTYFNAILTMIAEGLYPDNALLPLSYWTNLSENEWLNIMG